MLPEMLRRRLWQEADERFAYAVLDGAQNQGLLDWLLGPDAPMFECLFSGELAPDMAEVAPYLVQLVPGSKFTEELIETGWDENWGVLLVSAEELPAVWRHLRQHTMIYGAELDPMYFRFYDPRVLRHFLPGCNAEQLRGFFGCVNFFLTEADAATPMAADVWSLADGELVHEQVKLA